MLLPATLSLLVAAAQAGPSPYGPPVKPQLCGRQPCFPPNRCDPGPGFTVCVLPREPTCAATSCGAGRECVLQQDTCNRRPCSPRPACIKQGTNPCGTCRVRFEFCELRPSNGSPPTCRDVVEPRCDNKICPPGEQCVEEPIDCPRPPCGPNLACRPRPYG